MNLSKEVKRKIFITLCILVIIVSLILNIVLLSANIFKGKYKAKDSDGNTITIIFYDNTYSMESRNGFFLYQKLADYNQTPTSMTLKKDCIVLLGTTTWESDTYYLYRDSVFHLSYAGRGNSSIKDMDFYCPSAIFLQVLYPLLILLSVVVLVMILNNKIFHIERKMDNKSD